MAPLRDAYLEPRARYASRKDLLEAADLAGTLGMICRVLTWRRILSGVEPSQRTDYADAVPGWLKEFLMASEAA